MMPELNWELDESWEPESWSDLAQMVLVRDGIKMACRRLRCAPNTLRSWITGERSPDLHHQSLLVRVSGVKPKVALAMIKAERRIKKTRDVMRAEEFQQCVDLLIRYHKMMANIIQFPGWDRRNTEKVSKILESTRTLLAKVDEFS